MKRIFNLVRGTTSSLETRVMFATIFFIATIFAFIIFGLTTVFARQDVKQEHEASHELNQNFAMTIAPLLARYELGALDRTLEVFVLRDDIVKVTIIDRYGEEVSERDHKGEADTVLSATYNASFDGRNVGTVIIEYIDPHTVSTYAQQILTAFMSFLICLVMGWITIGQYVKKFVKNPLRELQAACDETLATGVHHVAKLNDEGRFGAYVSSFNAMQDRLSELRSQKQALLQQVSNEKSMFDDFLRESGHAILVFDELGHCAMRRGLSIDQLIPEIGEDLSQNLVTFREKVDKLANSEQRELFQHEAYQIEVVDKGGHIRHIFFTFHHISNSRTAAYIFDGTKMHEGEKALSELQKMEALGQITSGVAHDFNNILASIQLNLSAFELSNHDNLSGVERELVAGADEAVKMGAELTKQLLTYAQKRVLKSESAKVADVIYEVVSFLKRAIGSQHEIVVKGPIIGSIDVDQVMLNRCLINLGLNARNALPDGGAIEISQRIQTIGKCKYTYIDVFNASEPLDKKVLARVFDPFFTTRPNEGGSGLGLSVVKGFVEQSGGLASLENFENGVRASMAFPFLEEDGYEIPSEQIDQELKKTGDQKTATILLIDDNLSILKGMGRLLDLMGHKVIKVQDFAKLDLKSLDVASIDLVISDIMMPGIDGIEAAKLLREANLNAPIYLLTGLELANIPQRIAHIKDIHVIGKPISKDKLEVLLEKHLISPHIKKQNDKNLAGA